MFKLIVNYAGSNAVVDAGCEAEALRVVEKFNTECKPNGFGWEVSYGSGLVITYFRIMVLRKLIKPEEIEFRFKDNVLLINKHGLFDHWPLDMDIASNDESLNELLQLRITSAESEV